MLYFWPEKSISICFFITISSFKSVWIPWGKHVYRLRKQEQCNFNCFWMTEETHLCRYSVVIVHNISMLRSQALLTCPGHISTICKAYRELGPGATLHRAQTKVSVEGRLFLQLSWCRSSWPVFCIAGPISRANSFDVCTHLKTFSTRAEYKNSLWSLCFLLFRDHKLKWILPPTMSFKTPFAITIPWIGGWHFKWTSPSGWILQVEMRNKGAWFAGCFWLQFATVFGIPHTSRRRVLAWQWDCWSLKPPVEALMSCFSGFARWWHAEYYSLGFLHWRSRFAFLHGNHPLHQLLGFDEGLETWMPGTKKSNRSKSI